MEPMHPITIYRGDDSAAFGVRSIVIKVDTGISFASATARFTLLSFTKEYTAAETATKEFVVEFPASVTKLFPLGMIFGTLVIIDQSVGHVGQVLTFADRIPFEVVLPGYCNPPLYERGIIEHGSDIFTIEAAWNYDSLVNRPSINGIVLTGNKTGAELGLASASQLSAVIDAYLTSAGTTLHVIKRDGTSFDFVGGGGGGTSGPCYPSTDGFMFIPAGKAIVTPGTPEIQVYRKQIFISDPDMGAVMDISDHRYRRDETTGDFIDIDPDPS